MSSRSVDVLLEAWRGTLGQDSGRAAIFDRTGKALRTFAQIEAESQELQEIVLTFAPGVVVAVQAGNHQSWPALFLASLRAELVIVPLESTLSSQQLDVSLRVTRASGLITSKGPSLQAQRVEPETQPIWPDSPPVLLKLTSGTTAEPRAIRFQSTQLLADCSNICDTMGITREDINFGVIPVSHSYGFSNLITPLIARGIPLVVSSDRMPRALLDGLAQTGATIFPGMPVFYQAFCELVEVAPLPRLRLCISAGAPLPLALAQLFRKKFGQPIHSFYGSSECGGICYDREGRSDVEAYVGTPMSGVLLELLQLDDTETQICVHSAAVGDGYFPAPEPEVLCHGAFTPGDILRKDGDGFRLVGRVSDVINVAGKKVHPAQIEAELRNFAGVREAIVFGRQSTSRNEEIAACVVSNGALPEEELLAHCRTRLSAWQVPRRIYFMESLPINERGKLSRREIARLFDR